MVRKVAPLRRLPCLYDILQIIFAAYDGTDLPKEMADWSLTSLQTQLIKIGARVVRHARAITFQLAEVAVSRGLFNCILAAIQRLRAPPVPT